MKFIVSSSKISSVLQKIGSIISSSNASIPILQNFIFDIENQNLKITASDLETTIITSIKVDDADQDFKVTIQSRLLIDILKSLPEQPISFVFDSKSSLLELHSEYGKYSLAYEPNHELFPKTPEIDQKKEITLSSEILKNTLNKTLFAISNDDAKPTIQGLLFDIKEDHINFVSTDTYKLTKYKINFDTKDEKQIIVPKKPLVLIKTFLENAEEDDDILIEYNEKNIKFTIDAATIVVRLITGKYPNYEAVIPQKNDKILIINNNSLLNSLKRLSLLSNKSNNQINFELSQYTTKLTSEDADFSKKGEEKLKCEYSDNQSMEIGFNSKFLIETLANIETTDDIKMAISESNQPILIKTTAKEENKEHISLVMPIILN